MAHIQTTYAQLWKPQDLSIDKISSQKMFVDNINQTENIILSLLQNVHQSVKTLSELRAIDTTDATLFKTGMLIMVHEYGMYQFNRASTADESNAVVKPTIGVGRWITTTPTEIALAPIAVNTTAELDALLTNMVNQMTPSSIRFTMIRGLGGTEAPLYGGVGHATIYKSSDGAYATVTMIMYNHDYVALYYTRTRYGNVWGRWVTLPYLDENGKIPFSQLPSGVLNASIE